jgi:TPP-dependent 2-oxoacid decarboxylase
VAFTVADYILKRLSEQQVDTLFGLPAAACRASLNPFYSSGHARQS